MKELSIVRENLMTEPNYTGYCGNMKCRVMSRTKWISDLNQFKCSFCGWISKYPEDFIKRYKEKWNK